MREGNSVLFDPEFGEIKVRRTGGHYIRLKIDEQRRVRASLPHFVSLRTLVKFIDKSRLSLRKSLAKMPEPQKKITDQERKILKKRADVWLKQRLRELSRQYDLHYDRVRIMNAKTRWGSYSQTGTISLNYALMTLPETLRDYVILHELTHSLHMNHSREFWSQLGQFYPDYQQARKEMRKHSPYL
jgi:predicted metal-dependent hydrolase